MKRSRAEAALAVVIAAAIMLLGGAAIYFVSTISVHPDPAAVPSTAADAHAAGYSGAIDESRRLARALLVHENLPGFSVAVAVVALLQAPLRLESGASTEYALGWKVERVQLAGAATRLLGHRGSPIGGTTSLLTFPDLGLVIAAASNISDAKGVAPLGLKVAEAFAKPAREHIRQTSQDR